jgi:putative transposase
MARPPRLDFPGARHHVMNRGARRQPIFGDDTMRSLFLTAVAELPERFGVRIHGFVLMPNHYHLQLESPRGNLSRAMRHLGARFTQQTNAIGGWDGPLFRGRFRNRVVDDDAYWRHLLVYLHLNPVRAGLAPFADATSWTSHTAYAGLGPAQEWLVMDELLALHGGREGYRRYLWEYTAGRIEVPPGFDPEAFFGAPVTAAVTRPAAPSPLLGRDEALAAYLRVTGATPESLRAGQRGKGGNPARQLAAWWLVRAANLPQREVAAELGTSVTLVSRWLRAIRSERSPEVDAWFNALEDELSRPARVSK